MYKKVFNQSKAFRFKRFAHKAYSAFNSMHKVVSIGVVAVYVLTFAHTKNASAQSISTVNQWQENKPPEYELDEVTVSASRIETPLNQAAQIVSVITKEEIARQPIQSIQDLLNYAASIDVVQRGGHGVQADISIRGGSADQTAVLLNGINLSNSHTGHYSFDIPINLSDIERIEILHGPSALIYGSSAFSGGINIITKKRKNDKLAARIEGGMHTLRNAEVRSEADFGQSHNSFSAGYEASDGYIEHSDYSIYNLLWQSRLNVSEKSYFDFQGGYNNKHYGANTFYSATYPNQYERTSAIVGSASGVVGIGKSLNFVPQIYWTRHYDQFDLIKNTDKGRNYHRSDTYGANMMFRLSSRLGATDFGGEMRREEIVSSNLGEPMAHSHGHYTHYDGRTQTNIVAMHSANIGKITFSAGVAANYNTLQNDKFRFYPSLNIAYKPLYCLKLYATWSRSGRLPTFTDLYYTTETHNANGRLEAERSESFDVSAIYYNDFFMLTLTGYIMKGRNMIDWVRANANDKWASWNLTKLDKQGLEAQIVVPLDKLTTVLGTKPTFVMSYARTHQNCDSQDLESKYTLNYLRDKFTAHLAHSYGNFSFNWNFRYQKRMGSFSKYENAQYIGLSAYPAFSTLDLRFGYMFKKILFYIDVNNLYDTSYYDIGNVPQSGIWILAGVKIRIVK